MSNDLAERPILIIDDDPKLLAFVGRRLRQEQFMVETALNGRDGLDRASSDPPSLVLLDLSMPVMNGIETLTSLRQWYDGPIIILSATEEEHQKVKALDLGADGYLTKPFGLEELVARVRSALRRVQRVAQSQVNNDPIINAGQLSIDLGTPNRHQGWRRGLADPHRIRTAPLLGIQHRKGDDPPRTAPRGLGAGIRRRNRVPSHLH